MASSMVYHFNNDIDGLGRDPWITIYYREKGD